MGELYNYIKKIYDNPNQDDECMFWIDETSVDVVYKSESNELEFEITFDDYMPIIHNKNCSKAVDFICDRFKDSGLKIDYSTFDGLGEAFLDVNWTINIHENEKEVLLEFISGFEKSITRLEKKQEVLRRERGLAKNGYKPVKRKVKFRPKARLLSVLGEQLISNEIIAIKELVLNSYDADAKEVYINFKSDQTGKINELIILDNGNGMNEDIIVNGWFTPATSLKTKEKKFNTSPKLGRPIMGEKGVGRFACRRLGESLEVTTRSNGEKNELFYQIEWSQYDIDEDDVYLDDIENTIYSRPITNNQLLVEPTLNSFDSGTCLRITSLKDNWDNSKIENIKRELLKLTPPFQKIVDFKILINNIELKNDIFLEKAKFYMEGIVDNTGNLYYIIGTYPREHKLKPGEFINTIDFSLDIEEQLASLPDKFQKDNLLDSTVDSKAWTTYIKQKYTSKGIERSSLPVCGNFTFIAYAWDLDIKSKKKVGINDNNSKEMLKSFNGISIYRDGFRVWPYGAPGNDWLDLDGRAEGGQKPLHISNKQVIGYVGISQKNHEYFRDKTNREGFIENNLYFEDFKKLILISFRHLEDLRQKNNSKETPPKDKEWWQKDKVLIALKEIYEKVKNKSPELIKSIETLSTIYNERKRETESKIANLLEISSSGVVYESVTHELISFLVKMDEQSKYIEESLSMNPPQIEDAKDSNILLNEALKIVLCEVKELQPYFKAAKYQLKELNIREIAEKSMKYFKYKLKKNAISYKIIEISPMKRKAVEGFILQVLTNLIDNSIYWLDYDNNSNKQILITIDGNNSAFYFCDNGKGVNDDDIPYVFEAFFSHKINEDGSRGRGLGLYIVQELLSNYRGTIYIDDIFKPEGCTEKRKGACFKILIP